MRGLHSECLAQFKRSRSCENYDPSMALRIDCFLPRIDRRSPSYLTLLDSGEMPILASTGAAAVLLGGRTFHSFFGLGIMDGGPDATFQRASQDKKQSGTDRPQGKCDDDKDDGGSNLEAFINISGNYRQPGNSPG